MKVRDLMEKLQKLDPDLYVAVCDEEIGWGEASFATNTDNFHRADYSACRLNDGTVWEGRYVQIS